MKIAFGGMPSWVIVALVSRVARHVQGAIQDRSESDRTVVNAAIQVAEDSARRGCIDGHASALSHSAREVAENAKKDGRPKASHAAFCASEAATAVCVAMERHELVETVQRALQHAREALKPECYGVFEDDIQQVARLGRGLADEAAVPPEMLDFVHQQAVHEAGHAVAACHLGIRFNEVRVIYDAEVDFLANPIDDPEDIPPEERFPYRLAYAAGAAAEDLIYSRRREWACADDRRCHEQCGGTDFNEDVSKVRRLPGFASRAIQNVASLLEEHRVLSWDQVENAIRECDPQFPSRN